MVGSHRERDHAGPGRRYRPRSQVRRPVVAGARWSSTRQGDTATGAGAAPPCSSGCRTQLPTRHRRGTAPGGCEGHDARQDGQVERERAGEGVRALAMSPRANHSPTRSHSTLPRPPMRFREFSDLSDHAGQIPSVGTRPVRRYVSIGCEPVPPHEVEQPSCVHCGSRPI